MPRALSRARTTREGHALSHEIGDLVRLDRYPIDAPDEPAYAALVSECRRQIEELGCCSLPGFLADGALDAMREESLAVAPLAHLLAPLARL